MDYSPHHTPSYPLSSWPPQASLVSSQWTNPLANPPLYSFVFQAPPGFLLFFCGLCFQIRFWAFPRIICVRELPSEKASQHVNVISIGPDDLSLWLALCSMHPPQFRMIGFQHSAATREGCRYSCQWNAMFHVPLAHRRPNRHNPDCMQSGGARHPTITRSARSHCARSI